MAVPPRNLQSSPRRVCCRGSSNTTSFALHLALSMVKPSTISMPKRFVVSCFRYALVDCIALIDLHCYCAGTRWCIVFDRAHHSRKHSSCSNDSQEREQAQSFAVHRLLLCSCEFVHYACSRMSNERSAAANDTACLAHVMSMCINT
jgi:hypothetical protein